MACWQCNLVPLPGRPCPWEGEGGRNSAKCVPKNSFLGVEISSPRYITAKDVLFSKTTHSKSQEGETRQRLSFPPLYLNTCSVSHSPHHPSWEGGRHLQFFWSVIRHLLFRCIYSHRHWASSSCHHLSYVYFGLLSNLLFQSLIQ